MTMSNSGRRAGHGAVSGVVVVGGVVVVVVVVEDGWGVAVASVVPPVCWPALQQQQARVRDMTNRA
jgi:hypothetical protein